MVGGGGMVDDMEGEWMMIWRGRSARNGGVVDDDMEGWWMIWRGEMDGMEWIIWRKSGGRYGGGVVEQWDNMGGSGG